MVLSVCLIPTRFGLSLLGWRKNIELFILPQRTEESVFTHLNRWGFGRNDIEEAHPPFPAITETIQAYFEGKHTTFPYPLALEGFPLLTRRILEAVAQIPYGTTLTYGDIAKKIALPCTPRAVGRALRGNSLPLFIPCHRVIGKHNLGGFSGYGLRYKILLLSLEFSGNCFCRNCPF